jgi:hypothetical protein
MCQLCGESSFGAHDISISERPRQLLGGLRWSGTHEQAASGETESLLRRVQAFSASRKAAWKSPIVALSRALGEGSFECFAGIAVEPGEALPAGFDLLDLVEMTVASSWHGQQDGDVVTHYGHILDWIRTSGHRRDRTHYDHREEYPHDADLDAPPALRLMLPVQPVEVATTRMTGGFSATSV